MHIKSSVYCICFVLYFHGFQVNVRVHVNIELICAAMCFQGLGVFIVFELSCIFMVWRYMYM